MAKTVNWEKVADHMLEAANGLAMDPNDPLFNTKMTLTVIGQGIKKSLVETTSRVRVVDKADEVV